MFAHVSLGISDIERSVAFYDEVLETLGYSRLFGDVAEQFMAYGDEDAFFIINTPIEPELSALTLNNGAHICLKAPDQKAVDRFYETALAIGGRCAGAPAIREHYALDYYATYIRDPDGHKIEALARAR